jgi:hypothetical protein
MIKGVWYEPGERESCLVASVRLAFFVQPEIRETTAMIGWINRRENRVNAKMPNAGTKNNNGF